MAEPWTFSFRDGHGTVIEVKVDEAQARGFLAGQGLSYWSSAPEDVSIDEAGELHEHHDARNQPDPPTEDDGHARDAAGDTCQQHD
jgi:hypothetical protein